MAEQGTQLSCDCPLLRTGKTVSASDGSSISVPSSGNTISTTKNIAKDTYAVTITGTKESTDAPIGIDYSVSGKASAPTNPSTLSFTVTNVNTGHLTVEILQGSTVVYQQTFAIIVRQSTPPSGGSGGSGGASGGAAAVVAAPVVAAPVVPAGVTATTATLQQNEQGQVLATYEVASDPSAGFSSTLGITAGTAVLNPAGQPVSQVSVAPMAAASVPSNNNAGFSFSGMAVECGPSGTQFSTPATVSFSMTPTQWAAALAAVNGNTAAMTIQTYDSLTNTWSSIPTTVNPVTRTISAQVSHFSQYALFYEQSTSVATSPKTIGELANLPASTPASVAPVSTSAATPVNTQPAIVATPTPAQNAGFFDGIANWFAQLFGVK